MLAGRRPEFGPAADPSTPQFRMDINLNRGMPGMPQLPTQLPTLLLFLGGCAIFLGLLLLWNEALLRYLVAGVFLLIGALLLLTGLRAKRMLG